MKNIHILPTDKPTWLHKSLLSGVLRKSSSCIDDMKQAEGMNIYITSDEEINQQTEPCWCTNTIKNTWNADLIYYQGSMPQYHFVGFKKIILTTDRDLIKDGVQGIDDEFLEWVVKNPSCENVEVITEQYTQNYHKDIWYNRYKIIIPQEGSIQTQQMEDRIRGLNVDTGYRLQEEPNTNLERLPFPKLIKEFAEYYKKISLVDENNQETLEEAAEKLISQYELGNTGKIDSEDAKEMLIELIKWQAKKMYSEEDMKLAFEAGHDSARMKGSYKSNGTYQEDYNGWFDKFKKK